MRHIELFEEDEITLIGSADIIESGRPGEPEAVTWKGSVFLSMGKPTFGVIYVKTHSVALADDAVSVL